MAKISDILNPNSALNKAMRLPTLQNEINIEPEEIKNMLETQSEIDFAPVRAALAVEETVDLLERLSSDLDNERQERKRADNKSNKVAIAAIFISIVAIGITTLTGLDKIIENVQWLIEWIKSML